MDEKLVKSPKGIEYMSVAADATDDPKPASNGAKDTDKEKKEEIDIDQVTFDSRIAFVNKIKGCVEDREDIDIYQFVAFITAFDDVSNAYSKSKWMYIYEAIICIVAQIVGVTIIIEEVIRNGMDDKSSCNMDLDDHPLIYKLLAFSLSTVAGFVSWDIFKHEKGMYVGGYEDWGEKIKKQKGNKENVPFYTILWWFSIPSWVSIFWLEVGTWTNRIVAIGAVGGSFIVIYFSENAFDMVLNSVALFFLMELDNMLCTTDRYNVLKKYLDDWPADGKIQSITDIADDDEELRKKIAVNKMLKFSGNACCSCMLGLAMVIDFIWLLIYILFGKLAVLACVLIPFYIGICY